MTGQPVRRLAARVLLVDGDGRILLINERELEGGEPYWLTPGGGIEAGESPQQAAVREVFEETGIKVCIGADAEPVWRERRVWSFGGVSYDQSNAFFVARVPVGTRVHPAALTTLERASLIGCRWWTPAELRTCGERLFPAEIADLAELAGRVGPPEQA